MRSRRRGWGRRGRGGMRRSEELVATSCQTRSLSEDGVSLVLVLILILLVELLLEEEEPLLKPIVKPLMVRVVSGRWVPDLTRAV